MNGTGSLNRLERFVLSAVLSLRDEAYGVSIHARVHSMVHPKTVTLGVVYYTLDLLEDKGFLSSSLSDARPERGDRRRRYYRIEAIGERAVNESETSPLVLEALTDFLGRDWGRGWKRPWGKPAD
jgi:DNA-binding PadR family transcriptional regulator